MNSHRDPGLAGVSTLLNPQHVDVTQDVTKVENKFFNLDTSTQVTATEKPDENLQEINKLARELNIKLDGMPDTVSTVKHLDNTSSCSKRSYRPPSPRRTSPRGASTYSTTAVPLPIQYSPASTPVMHTERVFEAPPILPAPMSSVPIHHHPTTQTLTEEQHKKDHINKVLGNMSAGTNTFSTHIEQTLDTKASKLDQIASLKMTLAEEGIDTSDMNNVSFNSPIEEINSALAILTMKKNRSRYSALAEEGIVSMAELLETVFDGNTTIPILNISPDYRGYSNTVGVKLHRLRHETSQVVSGVVEGYNMSPFTRIAMEMLPSLILYPHTKSKQKKSRVVKSLSAVDSRSSFNNIRNKLEPIDTDVELQNL